MGSLSNSLMEKLQRLIRREEISFEVPIFSHSHRSVESVIPRMNQSLSTISDQLITYMDSMVHIG